MVDYHSLAVSAAQDGIARLVVGCVAVCGDKILLLRRRPDDFLGGLYELPSGEVEQGEALTDALKREVSEETGCVVEDVILHMGSFDYQARSGVRTRQFTFLVRLKDPVFITLTEHDMYAWVSRETLPAYMVSDNVRALLQSLWDGAWGQR